MGFPGDHDVQYGEQAYTCFLFSAHTGVFHGQTVKDMKEVADISSTVQYGSPTFERTPSEKSAACNQVIKYFKKCIYK